MKAVVFEQPNEIVIADRPRPVPANDEVLVKVAACGICGTDLHILRGEFLAEYPLIPGHEFAGTVAQVGRAAGDLKVGDRVCVDPNIFCNRCHFCRTGKSNLCENLGALGVRQSGGFAQYCVVPWSNLFPAP